MIQADVIIIGSGAAALQLAGSLPKHLNVIILTKSSVIKGNSAKAQGGIAAAISATDHPLLHYKDTLEAGRYINDSNAVRSLTQEAPAIIQELLAQGCTFDANHEGQIALGMEGSHQQHRIVHAGGDQTGKYIMETLLNNIGENVTVYENMHVYHLLMDRQHQQCYGVKARSSHDMAHTFVAAHVVLATGGCGGVYAITSNASTVTGDGIALAYQAGAAVIDMEFVQFHPTLLFVDGKAKGLVSEAVRGEGATLIDEQGFRIMTELHPLRDLAPRHVVSQAIYHHIQKGHNVYLDIAGIEDFSLRFPSISRLCEENGIAISDGRIPVAPGCHFLMGGVRTDSFGRTNVKGLYAIGETACTGVHGANRLASNSLLEGLVYGKRAAYAIQHSTNQQDFSAAPIERDIPNLPFSVSLPNQQLLKEKMMSYVGISRTRAELKQHLAWLESFSIRSLLQSSLEELSTEDITTFFMLMNSWLITSSALRREESRGGHFLTDFPFEKETWERKHIIHQIECREGFIHEHNKVASLY